MLVELQEGPGALEHAGGGGDAEEGTTWLDAFALVMTTSLGTPPMTATIAPRLHSFFSTAKAGTPEVGLLRLPRGGLGNVVGVLAVHGIELCFTTDMLCVMTMMGHRGRYLEHKLAR